MAVATNRYPVQRAGPRDYRRPAQPSRRPRPVPANDNAPRRTPKPWVPANDNRPVPKPGQWSVPRPPRIPGWNRWLRYVIRVHPVIGTLLTLYELYELYQYFRSIEPGNTGYVFCRDPAGRPVVETYHYTSATCAQQLPHTIAPKTWSTANPWYIRWSVHPSATFGTVWWPWDSTKYPANPGINPKSAPGPLPFPEVHPDHFPIRSPWTDPLTPPAPVPVRPPIRRPQRETEPEHIPNPDGLGPPRPRLPEDYESWEPLLPSRPQPQPKPERPGKDVKEKKIRAARSTIRRLLGAVVSGASEGFDLLESFHDALPDKLKTKDANLREKFNDVYQHLDQVDMQEAVQNLIENQVEDRIYGKGFADLTEALEAFGVELPSLKL